MTIYRLLLHLFPRSFRERFGEAIVDVFADRLHAARRQGGMATASFFFRTIADTLSHGITERFGGNTRDRTGDGFMSSLARDLRYAVRSLRLSPGFTVIALIVLTLGIGATTAIFSVVDAVVLRPLPFEDANQLIALNELSMTRRNAGPVAPQNYLDWKAQQGGVFEDLAASGGAAVTLRDRAEPEVLQVATVTANLFGLLRVAPEYGALFSAGNEVAGNQHVMLISDALWRRRFGADPTVVGRSVATSDGQWLIVGVMPPDFVFPVGLLKPIEVWAPYAPTAEERQRSSFSHSYYLTVIGRLRKGTTLEQARAKMNRVTTDLAHAYPDWFHDTWITLMPVHDALVGDVRTPMTALLVAVGLVLAIACANVANLVLARSIMRRPEIAIRVAIGASRWTVMRGLLVESLLLSLAGATLGLFVAWWGVHAMIALLPTSLPRLSTVGINVRVLTAAGIVAIGSGLVSGLMPAWQLSGQDLASVTRTGGGRAERGVGRVARTTFIVVEISTAIVLVVGAGLFLASYARMMQVDTGMEYQRVVSVPVRVRLDLASKDNRVSELARGGTIVRLIRNRLARLPGVEDTALMRGSDLWAHSSAGTSLSVPGREPLPQPQDRVELKNVSPGYFHTMGVRLLRGREFAAGDGPDIIINAAAARHFFGDLDPIGRAVESNGKRVIVGVAANVSLDGPENGTKPEVYYPLGDEYVSQIFVRLAPRALPSMETITRTINDMHLGATAATPQALTDRFDKLVRPRTLNTVLVSLFGVLALVIAAVGIYGVMAYIVAQRSGEIGIRMALGAQRAQIKMDVLSEAARLIGIGAVIGTAGAWMLARLVGTLLFQVEPHDPWLYAAAIAIFMIAGMVAAFVPARRAAMVDPVEAMRQ